MLRGRLPYSTLDGQYLQDYSTSVEQLNLAAQQSLIGNGSS